jgi:transposase
LRDFEETGAAEGQRFRYAGGMDIIDTLRQEVQEGRVGVERLLEFTASLQRQLLATQQQHQTALQELQAAKQRINELENKLGTPPAAAKLEQPFSMRAEEQRQQARGHKPKRKRKGRRGRLRTKDKIALAERHEQVFPEGVPATECYCSHTRPVWRLEQGRAVLVAYDIYRGRNGQYGHIPGVLGRSEFGLEIVTQIAFMVYMVGLSFDKVCLLLHFFQNLKLSKAQVDVLLYRLARHWEDQFEVLCTLLANSLVVHADETSWSVNSVWAFLSEKARVLLFGVHKDAATLEQLLDPTSFAGIVISDDAAVYANFSAAQKCWAHLLRKAIKLTLQEPDNTTYRDLTDRLLAVYRAACRLQRDGRYRDAGRATKVTELEDEVFALCGAVSFAEPSQLSERANEHRLLVAEVFRLLMAKQLFTFVTAAPVEQPNGTTTHVPGTNNEAERTLRNPAQARKTGRTNKTKDGARRQSIVTTVLESLRVYLPTFTLASVSAELARWTASGMSCFERLAKQLKLQPRDAATPILARLFADASPDAVPTG